jgi:PhnB protein
MTSTAQAIPAGYHSVTPYLCVREAARALAFYRQAFGAREIMRLADASGRIAHAEMIIGNAPIMLADEFPDMDVRSPQAFGGSPVTIHLYVDDVDALADQAVAAGATVLMPVEDRFYGDRSGKLADPFGHVWMIATHKEDVPPEEIQRRAAALGYS